MNVALLVVAGVGAGLAGSTAGLASLISYPALLAVGLPPLTANVTNTVALVFSSIGSVSASRPELAQQRDRLVRLVPAAVLGGALGALLLLLTPTETFERIVPLLIAAASLAVVLRTRPPTIAHAPAAARPRHDSRWLVVGVGGIGIYGGYFGAAAGVLLLAVVLHATDEVLATGNALKNVLLGAANLVAAIGFALVAHVAWLAALPLAIGFLVGGRIGPWVVRRVPAAPLRIGIGVIGLGLAVKLGLVARVVS